MSVTVTGICSGYQAVNRNTFRSECIPDCRIFTKMMDDSNKLRAALQAFMKSTGLKEFPWERKAQVSEGVLRAFLTGRSKTMTEITLTKLAVGATELLGRRVTMAELRGELKNTTVPITSRVGAGERVYPFDGDAPLGYAQAPAGIDVTEAYEVDGHSMLPLYNPRDLLFPARKHREPSALIGRVVVAQVKNGPRVVKILQRGSTRGRWNLQSVNPAHQTMEDQALEWVAMIGVAVYYTGAT